MSFIRFAENSILDAESVCFIAGNYTAKDPQKWKTDLVVGGIALTIEGQPGKNIMDAVIWHRKNGIIDMIPGDNYKKKLSN